MKKSKRLGGKKEETLCQLSDAKIKELSDWRGTFVRSTARIAYG